MHALIDGRALHLPAGAPYAQAFDAARRDAAQRGRMVVAVSRDGRSLSPDEVDAAASLPDDEARVEFTSDTPASLVRAAMSDAAIVLRSTDAARADAVKHLRAGRLGDALRAIQDVTSHWEQVRAAIEHAAELLGIPAPSLLGWPGASPSPDPGPSPLLALSDCLAEVARCVRDADWSGLADALEFDLAELSEHWVDRLIETVRRIDDQNTQTPRLVA